METLPSDLWKAIFGFIPAHRYAARCVCRAWRTCCGEEPATISPRTILEQEEDPEWLIFAASAWWSDIEANSLLKQAAAAENMKGMELAEAWGATELDKAFKCAAAHGQLKAMGLLKEWGADAFDRAFLCAAASGQLEAMRLAKAWGATVFNFAFLRAAENGQLAAMGLLKEWGATAEEGHLEARYVLRKWGRERLRQGSHMGRRRRPARGDEVIVPIAHVGRG